MKRFVLALLATLGLAGLATAQTGSLSLNNFGDNAFSNFAAPSERVRLTETVTGDTVAAPAAPTPQPADPQPAPRFYFGNSDDFRFQLGLGYQYVRFRSTAFNANLNGLQTSLSYFMNDWFAIEGNVVAALGTQVFGSDRSKYLLYTGGGRIAWRGEKRRWEPWMHALIGGLHMTPQTSLGGKNGFALQAGAGADYRLTSNVSIRVGGDYVRSQLYSQSQNNFQGGAGIVVHF